MTEQEIEKLREKLGSEYSVKRLNGAITVELADIWEGIEFAECVEYHKGSRTGAEIIKGHIYKITDWFKRELVYIDGFEYGWPVSFFNPSTESAYVEQLKAKACELYGEIKDGDRFDRSDMEFGIPQAIDRMSSIELGWDYSNGDDQLYLGDLCLYSKGKWAKKIQQAIVTPIEIHSEDPDIEGDQDISIVMKIIQGHISQKNRKDVAYHIAKCLEDYLNKS